MRVITRALAAIAVLTVAPMAGSAQPTETRTLAGDAAAIYNLAGIIRAEAAAGGDITVAITRRGPDGSRLRIAEGRIGGSETIRILYPENRIRYRDDDEGGRTRTTVHVREDGTFYEGGSSDDDGRRVTISSTGTGMEASADLLVRIPRGRRVSFFLAAGRLEIANVEGELYANVGSAKVDVTATRGSLRLDTGSGRTRVRDASGDLVLDSGSGSVEIDNVRGGSLRLDSGSGSVRGRGIDFKSMNLDSGSGSVELLDLTAPDLRLDSGSGSVRLGFVADIENVRIDAGSGSVTVAIPETLGAQVDIASGSGGVDADFPLTVLTVGRNRLRGTVGDGKGRLEIDGGSGAIRLRRRIP